MWLVCQLGAREHYAIPRALLRSGSLGGLCTDVWANSLFRAVAPLAGRRGKALAARYHSGIPSALVKHWTADSLRRLLHERHRYQSPYDRFIAEGEWFGGKVRKWLDSGIKCPEVIFSYDTTALEPFEWAKERGTRLILGQMDPGRVEAEIVAKEREAWPGWESVAGVVPEAYHCRRAAEWELADRIIVNSAWSRDALLQQGVPEAKLVIVPLVYEADEKAESEKLDAGMMKGPTARAPFRVLFLGQVNLRKGIPYLMEAARLLDPDRVVFDVVGPIQISERALAGAPRNVRFHGPVSRDAVASCYRRADAFVLPTLSDGFAITQLEAMAYGLPVITTSCCGEVVTDDEDGRIVPARDPVALAEAVLALASDRDKLASMSTAARGKSRQFTIDRLAACLTDI